MQVDEEELQGALDTLAVRLDEFLATVPASMSR